MNKHLMHDMSPDLPMGAFVRAPGKNRPATLEAQVQQPVNAAAGPQSAMQANYAARQAVLQQGYPMLQQIASGSINPANQQIVNVPPQNVGLIKGFLVEVVTNFTVAATDALALTPFGAANILQNVLFQDLQNYQRINTTGWHIAFLNSARQGRPFMSNTASDYPSGTGGFGSNYRAQYAPAAPAATDTYAMRTYYWIPLCYSHNDLTGAIYAGVVNATMNLQLTFCTSAQFAVANGDPATAVYSGNTATVNSHTYTIYQSYIDQLPVNPKGGGLILPAIDLNTIYELKNVTTPSIVQAQDNYIGYSNFRHFMSTFAFFHNGSAWNSAPNSGTNPYPGENGEFGADINYWSFRTANYTDTRKADPFTWKGLEAQKLLEQFPVEMFYFDTRDKPIYTTQTGNVNLVLNPSIANSGAYVQTAYEMLANVNNLVNAGSLGVS